MHKTDDKGRRLYKGRGPDGEVAWVDHDELWRLQQSQAKELRRGHARRHRLLVLALTGLAVVALAAAIFWWRSAAAPKLEGTGVPVAVAAEPEGGPVSEAVDPERAPIETAADREPSPSDRVAAAVTTWAEAWARQDVPAYLAGYATGFEPDRGLSRSDWESLRRRRLLGPASIEVEIEGLEITFGEQGRAEARFVQRYNSPTYSDVVRKRLQLVQEAGEWRIAAESSAPPGDSDLG